MITKFAAVAFVLYVICFVVIGRALFGTWNFFKMLDRAYKERAHQ